jgi:hypothetical protein
MHFNAEDFHVLRHVQTYSIHQRQHKVSVADFMDVSAWQARPTLRLLFPHILKGKDILSVVDGFVAAHRRGRAIIFALGAHVIKCGLSPLLIEMMRRGWLQGLVLNGAGAIHDLEVALIGMTSEDVAQNLISGQFGMVAETPQLMNKALQEFEGEHVGMGAALGQALAQGDFPYRQYSLLAAACMTAVVIGILARRCCYPKSFSRPSPSVAMLAIQWSVFSR